MKYDKITGKQFESLNQVDTISSFKSYEETSFRHCNFSNCVWENCKFFRTSFSNNTVFRDCKFINCRFFGQHTYFGGPTLFESCNFVDCKIVGTQFWDTNFNYTCFSGQIENVVFYGPQSPKGWETILHTVDFSNCDLSLVDFKCGIDLSNTILPSIKSASCD